MNWRVMTLLAPPKKRANGPFIRWCCSPRKIFSNIKAGVELRIWLKQGKEKAQTRKGKKTAGKEKRLLARKKDC